MADKDKRGEAFGHTKPATYGGTFKNASSDGFAGKGNPIQEHGKPKATSKGSSRDKRG